MPQSDVILVVNAGSSSIKFSLYPAADDGRPLGGGIIEGIGVQPQFKAEFAGKAFKDDWPDGAGLDHEHFYGFLLDWLARETPETTVVAAGHRVVHGGTDFAAPVVVDAAVLSALEALVPLAPLHQPHNLAAIRTLSERAPAIPQVACFDTAFHRSIPARDQLYGLPLDLAEAGLRRYGFHGLSYEFVAGVLPDYDAGAAAGRTIVAHLGNGASLCALKDGESRACTMGFSTLDGLIMGTRCGSIDPGVLIYLLREKGLDADGLEKLLYKESGLLGLSGLSADMRDLLASDRPEARQAVEMFCDRVAQQIAGLAALLGGLDAVVFTAGIGERSAPIRAAICARLAWLGAELDPAANAAGEARIAAAASRLGLWIVPTDEESMIARHSRGLLAGAPAETARA
ncbi:acetate/propionate family kinase [Pelagibius marinus]|uniref:acetate/propionate family kinase n=1 Tax=Pelagibius marinus TaxID=2762760 RepID=UPI001872FE64|nr:acetate/propionate family kinase [Pelagibius marinus]